MEQRSLKHAAQAAVAIPIISKPASSTRLALATSELSRVGSSTLATAQYEHVTTGMTQKQRQAYVLKQRADEARIQQLRGIFAAYDEDRDGLLNDVELASAVLALGMDPSVKHLQRFQMLSPQPSGVDLATFVKVCMSKAYPSTVSDPSDSSATATLALFRSLDETGSGRVPLAILLHVLAEVAAPTALTMVEVQDLLRMSGILTPAVAADPRLLYSMEVDYTDFIRLCAWVPAKAAKTGR